MKSFLRQSMPAEQIRVLVVDDSTTHRQLLTYILKNEKYDVIEAKDGIEAIEKAQQHKPDLIITDILMPGMDGYELINQIKHNKNLADVQIVLYTAQYQEEEAVNLANLFGIKYYLNKPAQKNELLSTIEQALHEKSKKLTKIKLDEISKKHLELVSNKLFHQVNDLEKLKSELEQRIVERTKELEKLNKKLHEDSTQDSLTGLFNRRYLDETLDREIARTQRNNKNFAVVMIDIDLFKQTNDQFGHSAGDLVLSSIAHFLKNNVRSEDILCRYGGEEFILVLLDVDENKLLDKLEKIRKGIELLEIKITGHTIKSITVSMGVAIFSQYKRKASALIDAADIALYQAKKLGRNRIVVYNNQMQEKS